MDFTSAETGHSEAALEKAIASLIKRGDLRFHASNKHSNLPVLDVPARRGLMAGFLTRPIEDRLGCGIAGFRGIQSHEYFQSIDWALVDKKKLKPPYKPQVIFKFI